MNKKNLPVSALRRVIDRAIETGGIPGSIPYVSAWETTFSSLSDEERSTINHFRRMEYYSHPKAADVEYICSLLAKVGLQTFADVKDEEPQGVHSKPWLIACEGNDGVWTIVAHYIVIVDRDGPVHEVPAIPEGQLSSVWRCKGTEQADAWLYCPQTGCKMHQLFGSRDQCVAALAEKLNHVQPGELVKQHERDSRDYWKYVPVPDLVGEKSLRDAKKVFTGPGRWVLYQDTMVGHTTTKWLFLKPGDLLGSKIVGQWNGQQVVLLSGV